MGKEDEAFFVKIKESSDVKRNLLESLKDIVENMQRFERFKNTREEKIRNINKLKVDIKELVKLNSQLKSALPEAKLRIAIKKAMKKKHKNPKKAAINEVERKTEKSVARSRPVSELEKLESELSAIEGKLSGLK